ncbi:PHOsphatase [Mortierella antarctica]|nr:PHOsphatase [Mortierella antarctica]
MPRPSFGHRSGPTLNLGFILPSVAAVFILLLLEAAAVDSGWPRAPQLDSALKVQEHCSSSTFDLRAKGELTRALEQTVEFTLLDERLSPPRSSVMSTALQQASQEEGQLAQTLAVIGGQEEHLQTPFSFPTESNPSHYSSKKIPFPSSSWIREHLASKSPYPHESRTAKPLKKEHIPLDHELVQLHLVCRHGTRYPSSTASVAIKTLSEKIRVVKVPGFEWLQTWRAETLYPVAKGSLLAPQGDSDLYKIGRRFAQRYKDFLDQHPYDANTYQFHSSGKSRCRQSAYGFTVGFLQGRHTDDPGKIVPKMESGKSPVQPVDISTLPVGMDTELAVKFSCPRWLDNVKGQPKVVYEANTYKGRVLPELAEQLSIRYASQDGVGMVNFTVKDVQTIYTACGFEMSLYGNDETWCQLLRLASPLRGLESEASHAGEEDIKSTFLKLEISSDLSKYYTFGPGVPFNRHLGCKLATSLLESIELALAPDEGNSPGSRSDDGDEDEEDTPKLFRGHFKFGHSETIMFFSSFLRLLDRKGVRMTATMTPEQYEAREFKTSDLTPFAANMAFEVYRPKAAKSNPGKWRLSDENETPLPPPASKGKVRMLVNEEPMIVPGCKAEFCEWATFKSILESAGARCDFETCCKSLGSPWLETMGRVMRDEIQDQLDDKCLAVDPITG